MDVAEQKSSHYDVIVVGAGPAGISAAINVANRKRSVVVLDGRAPFSKTRLAPSIPNYPGFQYATGEELAAAFLTHMERFEIPFLREKVSKVMPGEDEVLVFTDRDMYHAKAVILATGVSRGADLEGETELVGRGVSYCANCDGRLFAGREVAFISYIPEGEEEATILSEDLGVTVTYLPLYSGDPRLPEGVRVLPREHPSRLFRQDGKILVELASGPLAVDGVFVHKAGVAPGDLAEGIEVDGGHVVVDRAMSTALPGVFAAGDCTGEPYQIAKAVGEGQVAAVHALRYLRERPRPEAPPEPEEPPALAKEDRENLTRILLERMSGPVQFTFFGQAGGGGEAPVPVCDSCREARRLLEEFASLSDKLTLEVRDFRGDLDSATSLGVERIPATLVAAPGEERPRIRFFGVPEGYEFGALLDDVLAVSAGVPRLSAETLVALTAVRRPVHLEVLTTPTCPRCPDVVRLAHGFALASPMLTADMVAVSEFPEVARMHNVLSVPQVVVDGTVTSGGPLDEGRLLEAILAAGGSSS
ncbi:MAG: protein disulfide oxidoreductase [Thermoleophilia bacterium]